MLDFSSSAAHITLGEIHSSHEHLEATFNLHRDEFSVEEQVLLESRYGFNDYPVMKYPEIIAVLSKNLKRPPLPCKDLYAVKFQASRKLEQLAKGVPAQVEQSWADREPEPEPEPELFNDLILEMQEDETYTAVSEFGELNVIVRRVSSHDPERVSSIQQVACQVSEEEKVAEGLNFHT